MSVENNFQSNVEKVKVDTEISSKQGGLGYENAILDTSLDISENRAGNVDAEERRIVKHSWLYSFYVLWNVICHKALGSLHAPYFGTNMGCFDFLWGCCQEFE